ncbi:hypothetical protein BAY59_29190 [Prauserella coralliicola]|nr:hypothetical protein BAY59_29190 [Prauserella coralliicola]
MTSEQNRPRGCWVVCLPGDPDVTPFDPHGAWESPLHYPTRELAEADHLQVVRSYGPEHFGVSELPTTVAGAFELIPAEARRLQDPCCERWCRCGAVTHLQAGDPAECWSCGESEAA